MSTTTKTKGRLLFGNLLDHDLTVWKKIKFQIFPKVATEKGWNGKAQPLPGSDWSGWTDVAKEAGLVEKAKEKAAKIIEKDGWGFISEFITAPVAASAIPREYPKLPESKGRILEDKADEEMKDDSLEKENLPNYKVPSKFLLGAEFDFEITGKVVKSRRRGKQEIQYRVNFNDTPDDEYIYVDAAKLRKEYKAGAKAIQEYEDQLKRSRDAEAPPSQSQAKAKRSKGMAAAKAMLMVENGKRGGKKRKQAQPKFDDAIEELGTNSESFQSQPPEPVMAPKRHKRGRVVEEESEDSLDFFRTLDAKVNKRPSHDKRLKSRSQPSDPSHSRKKYNRASTKEATPKGHHADDGDSFDTLDDGAPTETVAKKFAGRYRSSQPESSFLSDNWKGVEIDDDIAVKNGQLLLKCLWPNGDRKTMTSKQAHQIPELRLKLLEVYEQKILAFRQVSFIFK